MGTVWTGLASRFGPGEAWPLLSQQEWCRWYREAEDLLRVGASQPEKSALLGNLLKRLKAVAPDACPARVAGVQGEESYFAPTAPAALVPAEFWGSSAGSFTLLSEHVARELLWRGGRVTDVVVDELATGGQRKISAGAVIVAAGPVGTAQLLWASRVAAGEASALGRNLTDHPMAFGCVALDAAAHDVADVRRCEPDGHPAYAMIPPSSDRPWLGYALHDKFPLTRLQGRVSRRVLINLYWYAIAAPRWENRLFFIDDATDVHGLPKPTFEYAVPHDERVTCRAMLDDLRRIGGLVGRFVPSAPAQLLSPGSSMHLMGTHAASTNDDGRSVTDDLGRVWGWDNLYLAGPGLIAHPTASGPTLTAVALALRTSDSIITGRTP
jgi:choline dehydrogenase-like flavoprotein